MTKDEYEELSDGLMLLSSHPDLTGELRDAIGELRHWLDERIYPTSSEES